MERRKFVLGLGSLAAGGAAALGTGAYKGMTVDAEREIDVGFEGDGAAYLRLYPTSPFAQYKSSSQGGSELGQRLTVTVDRLNIDANTRINEVFKVGNTTGQQVDLSVEEEPTFNGSGAQPDGMHILADDGSETRIDNGGSYSLGAGDSVAINFKFLVKDDRDVNVLPEELNIVADGAT